MKKSLLFALASFMVLVGFAQNKASWVELSKSQLTGSLYERSQEITDGAYFQFDINDLQSELNKAPQRIGATIKSSVIVSFPNTQGVLERYEIMESSNFHPDLAAQYPNIHSYIGRGMDDPSATIHISTSPLGLRSMVLSGQKEAIFIEPYTADLTSYVVYNRSNVLQTGAPFECEVMDQVQGRIAHDPNTALRNADDGILRDYRLAVSTTGEYTTYHGGVSGALAAINNTMTRVNGIFEIDFNVTMTLIANNTNVMYTSANSDPYTGSLNSQVQSTLSSVIGESNYDIGHLFTQASNNGNAGCIGCVCVNNQKGSAFTSHTVPQGDNFDVDYVAHEMGHQYGGNHTWTFNGNEGTNVQMEPGSGSTIMGYAGITGATDVQAHSDPYFHAITIEQITDYVKSTSCQSNTNTGNAVPTANAGSNFTIPRSTPFILTGSGTDANGGDVLTYCWEQMDENNASTTYPSATATAGVAFRSISPSTTPERHFPALSTVLAGNTSTQWEVVPSVGRTMNFRMTVRDNVVGGGTNNSDDMVVTVNSGTGPFVVNSPNTNVNWAAGSAQTVTWSVAGTNGSPVNATNVNILLSTDGGQTYPITVLANTSNDGSQVITVPNNQSTTCRMKVEAANNIFYDVSNTNFQISGTVVCNANVPTGLAVSGIGPNSATANWNAVSGASYDVRYRQTGTSTWTTNAVAGVSYSIAGLNTLTQYEVQVRSVCTSSNSAYSASVNFTTTDVQLNYCASNGNNVSDEYIGRVRLNTIDNSSGSGGGYTDHTSISTDLTKNTAYTITVNPTWTGTIYNEAYSVWIDYNQDGDFTDAGEQVWTQGNTQNATVSGTFTIPTSATDGNTRMRVSMKYNGIPTSCESFTYGEVEDYTVNVVTGGGGDTEAPTNPTNVTASSITETTATISWTASNDNVGVVHYNVSLNGSLLGTVTGTSASLTGLTAATAYSVSVTAEDAAGNVSGAGSTGFTTQNAADTQAPTNPGSISVTNIAVTAADLSWGSSTDNVGVVQYNVSLNGSLVGTPSSPSLGLTGLTALTTYNVSITAEDAAGNVSGATTTSFTTADNPPGGTTVLGGYFFESGLEGWTDGGADCARVSSARSFEGSYSVRIRDNSSSSVMTSPTYDLSTYDQLEVEFYFYPNSMENGEDFWLQFYNGSSYQTVASYAAGTSFSNNSFYTATVTVDANSFTFGNNNSIRFRCDASNNADRIYIDQVTVTGIVGTGRHTGNSIVQLHSLFDEDDARLDSDVVIYPNPANDYLNIQVADEDVEMIEIYSINGALVKRISNNMELQQIDISDLESGMYFIMIQSEDEVSTHKFVKM